MVEVTIKDLVDQRNVKMIDATALVQMKMYGSIALKLIMAVFSTANVVDAALLLQVTLLLQVALPVLQVRTIVVDDVIRVTEIIVVIECLIT